jgi:enolase
MSVTIFSVQGRSITDSRGIPTLSVTVKGIDGSTGTFDVPSGASTGIHEAHELRDDGTSHGGVQHALALLETEIAPALIGKDLLAQEEIDTLLITLDGTPTKERLGGNTLIGVSIALAKAAAASANKELWQHLHDSYFSEGETAFPRLYANLINGGKHASTALAFQEYHVVPKTTDMQEASSLIARVQESLGAKIAEHYAEVNMGDEGGYALPTADITKPLALLEETTEELGVRDQVDFALDVAASSFFDVTSGKYMIVDMPYDAPALTHVYENLSTAYGLLSIEDPFAEEDFAAFASLKGRVGATFLVGDDLTTTSRERLAQAIEMKSIDAIIIKPNQIGTLTETIGTMKLARKNGIKCIISHRSGETLDTFIADLAYASGAFGIKLGAHGPAEREAKYARLLTIEQAQ